MTTRIVDPPSDLRYRYQAPAYRGHKTEACLSHTEFATMSSVILSVVDNSNIHRHVHSDRFWFVLRGHLRFFNEDGELLADVGPEAGIEIPRGYAYRYEISPEGPDAVVEAFRFSAADVPMSSSSDDRQNLEPPLAQQDPLLSADGRFAHDTVTESPFGVPQVFSYIAPKVEMRKVEILALTDRGVFGFQVLRSGGEISMHSHPHLDGFWFVRRGSARFYTLGDNGTEVLAELRAGDGVLIPKGFPYSFEVVELGSEGECELMQMECADVAISGKREELTADVVHYGESNFGREQR